MGAIMALSEQQIHEAADEIAASGERPTLAAVRAKLGGGSFTTIGEALKTWREAQTEDHALAQVELPEPVQERLEAATAALWQAAVAEAERRLLAERQALTEAQAEAECAVTEAKEAVTTLEAEAADYQQEIERLKAALAEAEATAQQEAKGRQQTEQRAAAAEARLEQAQATVQALIERIPQKSGA